MRRFVPVVFVVMLAAPDPSAGQQKVDAVGITPKIKLEEIVSGHLAELNGKYKLRVTEVPFEPGAHLGAHHHAGPGIRFVVSGKLLEILPIDWAGPTVIPPKAF